MNAQATKLRNLADHVEKLVDGTKAYAAKMEWSGPLTDRVKGELSTWKTRSSEVAVKLRAEADELEKEAKRLATPTTH